MTEKLTLHGRLLAASSNDRTVRGLLLPFGEEGRTNRGRVTAQRGTVTIPAPETVLLNLGHDGDRPVGRATKIEETDEGLIAEFSIARTPNGDLLLAEAEEGLRRGLSVELEDIVIRAGKLVSSLLSGVGAVVKPAFASAQLVAEDAGEVPPEESETPPADDEETENSGDADSSSVNNDPSDEEGQDKEKDMGSSAAAPTDLKASAASRGGARLTADKIETPQDLYKLLAEAHSNRDRRLLAALADITETGIGVDVSQASWLGQLWSGVPYERRIVPLVNHADLTSYKVSGWRWVTKPEVDVYAGNKAAVPSNTPDTEPVEVEAERLAGAHDIDRKFRDFGDEGFFQSYYQAMAESYAKKSDVALLTDLVAGAGTPLTLAAAPTGVSAEWTAVVDTALDIIDIGTPSFAVVATDVYRSLLLTPKDQAFEFLTASLGLQDGSLTGFRIVPDSSVLTAGQILVGAKQAATFHELPGSPIRVEAVDMVNGGVDAGVFGYYATVVHDSRALAISDTSPGA